MAQFDHGNVVKLVGVVTVGAPLLVVMEYCSLGSLDAYVKVIDTSDRKKVQIAADCAAGMAYLASRKFIHRDLAARNIFLDSDARAKIGDFGMSREAVGRDYYLSKGGQLPIRWTAPECLEEHKFSEQSDVWSFGILLYELWTRAELPYKGWRNEKVWVQVLGGYRLESPADCPTEVYWLMMSCWKDAGSRPPFATLAEALGDALGGMSDVLTAQYSSYNPGDDTTSIAYKDVSLTHASGDVTAQRQASVITNRDPDYITGPVAVKRKSELTYLEPDTDLLAGGGFPSTESANGASIKQKSQLTYLDPDVALLERPYDDLMLMQAPQGSGPSFVDGLTPAEAPAQLLGKEVSVRFTYFCLTRLAGCSRGRRDRTRAALG